MGALTTLAVLSLRATLHLCQSPASKRARREQAAPFRARGLLSALCLPTGNDQSLAEQPRLADDWRASRTCRIAADGSSALSLDYSETAGAWTLRQAVAALYDDLEPEQVIVTSGAVEAIALTLEALVEPGTRSCWRAHIRILRAAVAPPRGGGHVLRARRGRRLRVRLRAPWRSSSATAARSSWS